jgi:hypothetical protein
LYLIVRVENLIKTSNLFKSFLQNACSAIQK